MRTGEIKTDSVQTYIDWNNLSDKTVENLTQLKLRFTKLE